MLIPFLSADTYLVSGIIFLLLGLSVGFLALKEQPRNNFNIRPDLKDNCVLITKGVYAYIRHPMYFSVMVSMLGILLLRFNTLELIFYIILVLNMMIKMFYEEKLWHCDGDEYRAYAQNTKRLIPFIF